MKTLDIDLLGLDTDHYPKPKRKKPQRLKHLGKLYDLLLTGLPDYIIEGVLDVTKLSQDVGISYQAIYKWFSREQISPKRIKIILNLSKNTMHRPKPAVVDGKKVPWQPLQQEDFWEFTAG